MLQTKAVSPRLLELLNYAMGRAELSDFVLVGGTSLALRLGHRISVDIDLFGNHNLDDLDLPGIFGDFAQTNLIKKSPKIQVFSVANVKLDIVSYRYPWIGSVEIIDHLRMASFEDIAAMKLAAITGRGSKKDFIDLYFLLRIFSLSEIFSFYTKKYADGSTFLVLKSLTYFEDAELDSMPEMIIDVEWNDVKANISRHVAALM